MSSLNTHLLQQLRDSLEGTSGLTERRMFGSDGLFANGYAFAIVWDGRIVIKLADDDACTRLLTHAGAEVFNPMGKGKGMTGWIVVPESFHDDIDELARWTKLAHTLIIRLPSKSSVKMTSSRAPKGTSRSSKKPTTIAKVTAKSRTSKPSRSQSSSKRPSARGKR